MKTGLRRSDRVYIQVPMTLAGKDRQGHTFEEKNRTVAISRHGARLETMQSLDAGHVLTVETPGGRRFEASVVWSGKQGAQGTNPIEIECPQFAEALGLYFPPEV